MHLPEAEDDRAEALFERGKIGGEIGFRDQDAVGEGGLLDRLAVAVEGHGAVHAIDARDDRRGPEAPRDHRVAGQRGEDADRIGDVRGLEEDAIDRLVDEVAEGADQVAAHRA